MAYAYPSCRKQVIEDLLVGLCGEAQKIKLDVCYASETWVSSVTPRVRAWLTSERKSGCESR